MKILDCNRKGQDLLGVGREEAVQRYIFEFIETEDIEEVLDTKKPVMHKKIKIDNDRLTVEETIVYIDNLDAALVTYQDVTREEKVREQHYKLKSRNCGNGAESDRKADDGRPGDRGAAWRDNGRDESYIDEIERLDIE